jgi:hypothetical protein
VIRQVAGQSLEDIGQGISLFAVPFAPCLAIVGLVGLFVLRIRTGQWRPTQWMVIGTRAAAFVLSLLPASVLIGEIGCPDFAGLIALCGLIPAIAFALAFFAGRAIILRLSPEQPGRRTAWSIALSVLIVAVLACSQARSNLPVPRWPATPADAAGSVRATGGQHIDFQIRQAVHLEFNDGEGNWPRAQVSFGGHGRCRCVVRTVPDTAGRAGRPQGDTQRVRCGLLLGIWLAQEGDVSIWARRLANSRQVVPKNRRAWDASVPGLWP